MTDKEFKRKLLLAKSGGVCAVCGKLLGSATQGAHKIADTKANRSKWGSFVIDSAENVAIVCSLKCNDKCNIGFNPCESLKIVKKIVDFEIEKCRREEK